MSMIGPMGGGVPYADTQTMWGEVGLSGTEDTTGQAEGWMEREAREKRGWSDVLNMLMQQLRRTDVELRHLTNDETLRETETRLLRTITLAKQVGLSTALFAPIAMGTAETGIGGALVATGYGAPIGLTLMAMAAVTSAGIMSELS